jgi:hypothetical protein
MTRQLSVAYDLYLALRRIVEQRVRVALRRDGPNYRLKHCCPACTYRLKDEKQLSFSLLFAMDGNDSLKRVRRHTPALDDTADPSHMAKSRERPDTRKCEDQYFLSREVVDALGAKLEEMHAVDEEVSDHASRVRTSLTMPDRHPRAIRAQRGGEI